MDFTEYFRNLNHSIPKQLANLDRFPLELNFEIRHPFDLGTGARIT